MFFEDDFKLSDLDEMSDATVTFFVIRIMILLIAAIVGLRYLIKLFKAFQDSNSNQTKERDKAFKLLNIITLAACIMGVFTYSFEFIEGSVFILDNTKVNGFSFLSNDILSSIEMVTESEIKYSESKINCLIVISCLLIVFMVVFSIIRCIKMVLCYFSNESTVNQLGRFVVTSFVFALSYWLFAVITKSFIENHVSEFANVSTKAYIPVIIQGVIMFLFFGYKREVNITEDSQLGNNTVDIKEKILNGWHECKEIFSVVKEVLTDRKNQKDEGDKVQTAMQNAYQNLWNNKGDDERK